MKKIIAGTFLFTALFSAAAFGADDAITLNIDGEELVCDVAPQIIDGRTMVPVRAIFEAVGAEVSYEGETKTVTAVKDDTTVIMVIDSTTEEINGEQLEMDTSPVIIDGRTLAPARFVAEAFGCEVAWNGNTKTVDITTPSDAEETTEAETETETETAAENPTADMTFFLENEIDGLEPIAYSSMTEESAYIHETIRYYFEQAALYSSLEENKDVLKEYIETEDYEASGKAIYTFWDSNMVNHMVAYSMENTDNGTQIGSFEGDVASKDFVEYIQNDCMLDGEQNFGVMLHEINDDTTMLLLQMAKDEYITSCDYIAVLFDKDCNFRYFTLEKSLDNYYAFCEVLENGHSTIQTFDSSFATKESFLLMVSSNYFLGNI